MQPATSFVITTDTNHCVITTNHHQARHLTSLCLMAEHFGLQPKIVEVATAMYNFVRDSFYDSATQAFFYIVSPDGSEKLEPGKQLYANMHGVAAFAYYGRVFGSEEALQIAVAV